MSNTSFPVGSDLPALEGRIHRLLRRVIELEQLNAELRRQAHHDLLTGLPNRRLLADRLSVGMARARRSRHPLAVCCLDLDGFKLINDTHGHAAGDVLLVTLARRLEQVVRAEETVARVGGDEFVLLLDLDLPTDLDPVLRRVLAAVHAPVDLGGQAVQVAASVGHVLYPAAMDDGVDADTLLRLADQAMYHAKREGQSLSRPAPLSTPAPAPSAPSASPRTRSQPPPEVFHAVSLQVAGDGRGPDDVRRSG
ncbi:GGDEF domain-containing protein [Leptothrix discophora]|uniref:GGDEF domain-containing protein n=1 Tax=Leptothrix discophora TaxID=89 RepID=A0ABT9G8J6_LEPDI|nr:GGDEF domain-containing protein [Leptothrix discophora]MDP4302795.1 GGDEF domain-containing protein [Leptothrix discophora]